MKPRFTPALSEFLEGNGWNIRIEEVGDESYPMKQEIHIIIEDIPEEDLKDQIKEMLKDATTVCTNG